jgi:cytochrome c-type biogenesis protein CcsB
MKKISEILFSSRLMAVIFLIFAVSIAIATFVENDYGSQTARAVIYNSWWFTVMLVTGIVNLTGSIFVKKLYRKEKLSIFIFHFSFLLILIGAAITRYFGFEGYMHIRSGEVSNQIVSSSTYFTASATANSETGNAEKQVYFSALSKNYHKLTLKVADKKVEVECLQIIPNAQETVVDDPQGEPMIELVVAGMDGRQSVILANRQTKQIGGVPFSFNDSTNISGISITSVDNQLQIRSHVTATVMNMASQLRDSLSPDTQYPLQLRSLYSFGGIQVVAKSYNPSGRIDVTSVKGAKPDMMPDALNLKVSSGGQSKTLLYFAVHNAANQPAEFKINNVVVLVSYGAKMIQVPFSLQLKQFILERYPGSNSPSWFESRVLLVDQKAGLKDDRRVFMNNVLKYKGYRFYQSSYDTDEQGTIFSVNHDYWGTLITYLGYLMLAVGMAISIVNRNSRFRKVSGELVRLREARKMASLIVVVVLASLFGSLKSQAQTTVPDSVYIDKQHAAKFGQLLIQDPGGRIKPLNTLGSELVRKISRTTQLMGQTSDQVLLGMLAFPEYWQNVPMIRVGHPEIQKILHIDKPYVSFAGVIDQHSAQNPYLLSTYVNEAYQKKPASRNMFDTEMIRLDERINVCYQIYNGDLLRIFPKQDDVAQTWYSPVSAAHVFKEKDSVFVNTILPLYASALREASKSKNLKLPEEVLGLIQNYQAKAGKALMPPPFKIKLETLYNKLNIFDRLGSFYGLVGFVLLIFQFVSIFRPKTNLKPATRIATVLIILGFVAHLAGLIARWYISGHAPWSNAYESLVYIAFATILAGLIFSHISSMALSVTSLLAWLILFVAHLNWMDPEITNLPPVLKSYWLLIHVAVITASYGFLALGALLAFINLTLMTAQNGKNLAATRGTIAELSMVIEMTLIVGLYMITIGTFLGGVWANESWGRYWGWDAKETWALVSVLVYAFVVHMRMVPGLKGNYTFNLMSLLAFSTIIMTYFGVNYYLSGMHSYAKGDPLPIPVFVYYTVAIVGLVAILAWVNQRRMKEIVAE